MEPPHRYQRITGERRRLLAAWYAERYRAGVPIRALARETNRSFGFVRTALVEAGVSLRPRGGTRQRWDDRAGAPGAAEPRPV
nr:helix-turn-helix domain-containing protein [Amycolatopsis arida]